MSDDADLRLRALEREIADLRETIRRRDRDLKLAAAEARQLSAVSEVACRLYADAFAASHALNRERGA